MKKSHDDKPAELFAFEVNYIKKVYTTPGLTWETEIHWKRAQMVSTTLREEDANQFAKRLKHSISPKNSLSIKVCKSSKSTIDNPLWRVVVNLSQLNTDSIKKKMAIILNEIHDPSGKNGWEFSKKILSYADVPTEFQDMDFGSEDNQTRKPFNEDFCKKATKYGWDQQMIEKFKTSIKFVSHHKCDEYIINEYFLPELFNMLSAYQKAKYQKLTNAVVQQLLPAKFPIDVNQFFGSFLSMRDVGRLTQINKTFATAAKNAKTKIDSIDAEQMNQPTVKI